MLKNKILRKALAVSLAAVMIGGTGFTTVGQFIGTGGITVSAARSYGDFRYELIGMLDEETVSITKYKGSGGDVIIPSYINGKPVTDIGSEAFLGCTGLTSITFPECLVSIGSDAFLGCTGLTSLTIPEGVSTGWGSFYNCTGLTSVTIPDGMTEMSMEVFRGCTGLTSVTIPDSVTSIESYAFADCTNLTNINFPDNLKDIKSGALDNTGWYNSQPDGLVYIGKVLYTYKGTMPENTTITIPDNVTSIAEEAFYDCTRLTGITIPDSVTSIESYAFYNCTGLTGIAIPDSVTYIGYYAFLHDTGLIIFGTKGSYAETYANEHDMLFMSEYTNLSTISTDETVLGKTVTVNAKAVLGEGDCTYAVLYKKKTDEKWVNKQNFSTNDTITIKPAYAADYDICVKSKDSMGKILKKYFELKVHDKLKITSEISASEIVEGTSVTVTNSATGGMGDYQYQVFYKQTAQSSWTKAQDFSENTTVTFRPARATTYDVCVKVKDETGKIDKKYFTVKVNEKLKNTSVISAQEITLGEKVTVTGSATGGMGDYQYQVLYKQAERTAWAMAQDFAENAAVTFKPAKAAAYDVCVKVKDETGKTEKLYFTVTVNTSTISPETYL